VMRVGDRQFRFGNWLFAPASHPRRIGLDGPDCCSAYALCLIQVTGAPQTRAENSPRFIDHLRDEGDRKQPLKFTSHWLCWAIANEWQRGCLPHQMWRPAAPRVSGRWEGRQCHAWPFGKAIPQSVLPALAASTAAGQPERLGGDVFASPRSTWERDRHAFARLKRPKTRFGGIEKNPVSWALRLCLAAPRAPSGTHRHPLK
jgi:hypothetical protein